MSPGKITSLKELQLMVPRILQQYGDNEQLAYIALANPIAALERIGFSFDPAVREEIEFRIRFGKQGSAKVTQFKKSIFKLTGKNIDINSPDSIQESLVEIFSGNKSTGKAKKALLKSALDEKKLQKILDIISEPPQAFEDKVKDPLTAYIKDHPIIKEIVRLRKMDVIYPKLADEATINKILEVKDNIPIKNIKFRLSRKNKK